MKIACETLHNTKDEFCVNHHQRHRSVSVDTHCFMASFHPASFVLSPLTVKAICLNSIYFATRTRRNCCMTAASFSSKEVANKGLDFSLCIWPLSINEVTARLFDTFPPPTVFIQSVPRRWWLRLSLLFAPPVANPPI